MSIARLLSVIDDTTGMGGMATEAPGGSKQRVAHYRLLATPDFY